LFLTDTSKSTTRSGGNGVMDFASSFWTEVLVRLDEKRLCKEPVSSGSARTGGKRGGSWAPPEDVDVNPCLERPRGGCRTRRIGSGPGPNRELRRAAFAIPSRAET